MRTHCCAEEDLVLYKNHLRERKMKMEEAIKQSIEDIRMFLLRDGGDIELVDITPENIVQVRLKGACNGCPGAAITLQTIVDRIIREAVPEVVGVEAVD